MLGCAVNGIGEASHADFGITGAKNEGLIFAHGKPLRKVPQDDLVDALFAEIDKSIDRGARGGRRAEGRRGRRLAPEDRGGERRRAHAGADRGDGGRRRVRGRPRRRPGAADGQRAKAERIGSTRSLADRGPPLHPRVAQSARQSSRRLRRTAMAIASAAGAGVQLGLRRAPRGCARWRGRCAAGRAISEPFRPEASRDKTVALARGQDPARRRYEAPRCRPGRAIPNRWSTLCADGQSGRRLDSAARDAALTATSCPR